MDKDDPMGAAIRELPISLDKRKALEEGSKQMLAKKNEPKSSFLDVKVPQMKDYVRTVNPELPPPPPRPMGDYKPRGKVMGAPTLATM